MNITLSSRSALFLDRDGVINRRIVGDYVKQVSDFVFLPQVREVLTELRPAFSRVVVVTNQQGIGKGLMSHEDLAALHQFMLSYLNAQVTVIDQVYYCPDLAVANSPDRKPAPGMAFRALADYPAIDLATSLMIGDSASDLAFGRRAGMQTIFFGNGDDEGEIVQGRCRDWADLATQWPHRAQAAH